MSKLHGSETEFELNTIERLKRSGYSHVNGGDLDRDSKSVVLLDVLRDSLTRRYPELSSEALQEAVDKITGPEGVDTLHRNRFFHTEILTKGFELKVEVKLPMVAEASETSYPNLMHSAPEIRQKVLHIYPVDWENPENNSFIVVNQLPISGVNDRRPDIIIFVNGLPLVLFELKNPYSEKPTVEDALNQIAHYTVHIPLLFEFNALCVASDGINTLHGMWTSGQEWYAPWKSIDGQKVENVMTGSMKVLIEGLFTKERLLSYIRHFIAFEVDKAGIVKKGAKYHQFFAVRSAVQRTLDSFKPDRDQRIGVIWHTTGAGKSLSMAYLVGILRKRPELKNPTFVIQVDRTDLDDQLHDQFVLVRDLVGDVKHAGKIDELRSLLQGEGGEVIFTTIEKFSLKRGETGKPIEVTHPVLSDRDNIIVIADEAHRSQYGFLQGFARYLREALPYAKRLGFTGTPVSFGDADTTEVFGDYIHTYDIRQSQEDKATVPIFYSPRQTKLHLTQSDIDAALQELASAATPEDEADLQRRKSRWAALASLAGTTERVNTIAQDILQHYQERSKMLNGKTMIVCMTRANCVKMYEALTSLPNSPEIQLVITANLSEDPKEWSEKGYTSTKGQRDRIKKRMRDIEDPLKLVIVCDMWLTGTDIPCLHTLYIDKPMRGHNMIQAISRVNRVFRDKPHGLIVDYIGVGDELREATNKYAQGGGRGEPAPGVSEAARPAFLASLDEVRALLPQNKQFGSWRSLDSIDREDLYSAVYGWLAESEEKRDAFLDGELKLTNAFMLVQQLPDCGVYADEIIFYQTVRKQINKGIVGNRKQKRDVDKAVRDLVDEHVESDSVIDIFRVAGIDNPDISILDDNFLQTFKDRPLQDLRLKLLERIIRDELQRRLPKNLARTRSFREMLETTIDKYHKRIIDAAAVVKAMVEMKNDMDSDDRRAKDLGLADDELAFYDAVSANYATIYSEPFLRDLIHEVVQTIKRNLKVDWTEPHREDVKAAVRAAVRRVLRRQNVKSEDFDGMLMRVMEQAAVLYADWPLAA
ncbi:MAG: type I restriction endonuclease subunit R [Candidatus Obscuribacterales bacterium]